MTDRIIGRCIFCGKENVEICLDFGGCMKCAEKYAHEQSLKEANG